MSGDRLIRSVADPEFVRGQYATEDGLAARKSVYSDVTGVDPRQVAFEAIAEVRPERVLEVGCGEGELADRLARELGLSVVAVDQSPRMVELACARGVDARVGDVQELAFDDAAFDAVLAAWMLYHVPDIDRALAEIARVLRPGGRLVAVTNYRDHLKEMFDLVGVEGWDLRPFAGEDGERVLRRFFPRVERRDGTGTVTFDTDAIRRYLGSSERLTPWIDRVPELSEPLLVRRRSVVLVADK